MLSVHISVITTSMAPLDNGKQASRLVGCCSRVIMRVRGTFDVLDKLV